MQLQCRLRRRRDQRALPAGAAARAAVVCLQTTSGWPMWPAQWAHMVHCSVYHRVRLRCISTALHCIALHCTAAAVEQCTAESCEYFGCMSVANSTLCCILCALCTRTWCRKSKRRWSRRPTTTTSCRRPRRRCVGSSRYGVLSRFDHSGRLRGCERYLRYSPIACPVDLSSAGKSAALFDRCDVLQHYSAQRVY